MAASYDVFNPAVPSGGDPNYTNISKPISDITPDKSTAISIEGAGNVLGEVVKATDTDIKAAAHEDVLAGVDRLRDGATDALKTIRNVQIASANQSLVPDSDAPDAPPQLQSGLQRVQSLGTAIAQNGGKINDTLYTGALVSLTKQLRAQYPGYRDYIDEQVQSVSGVNPANAFMKNLMEDINRKQEGDKTVVNGVLSTLKDAAATGYHDAGGTMASTVYTAVARGQLKPEQGLAWYNSAKSLDFDTKQKADARTNRQADQADDAVLATKDLSSTAAKTVAHNWSTMTIGKGTDTAEGLFKFVQANAGNQAVKDEQSQDIGQKLVALRTQTFATLMAQANEGGSNSLVNRLGGDPIKAATVINGQLATFDLAIQSVFNKDWGAAYSHMAFNKAISQDSTNILYNAPDDDTRRYNRMAGAINNISPQFAKDFFTQSLLGNVPPDQKEWLKTQKMEMITQPDTGIGKLKTFQGSLDAAKSTGANSPKTIDAIVKSVNDVSNTNLDPSQRLNVAKAFFDPANGQILSDRNFEMDHYDPVLKRNIPGKYSIWRTITSDNVASGIADLDKSNPGIAQQYRDTVSRNFGEQLFSRELKDLGNVNQEANTTSAYKIKFTNDRGTVPHFEAVRADGSPMTMTEAIAMRAPVQSLNRLNDGMAGLYNAYEKTGSKDPNSDVLTNIYRYNYAPTPGNNQAPKGSDGSFTGNAKAIWRSMVAAQTENLKKVQGRQSSPE